MLLGVVGQVSSSPASADETGTGGLFVPRTGELLNSFEGTGVPIGKIPANTTKSLQVAGSTVIPNHDVGAVVVTVTVQNSALNGQLYGGPSFEEQRGIMRYAANQHTTNTAILAVGDSGAIEVRASTDANIIVRVQGYYTAGNGDAAAGGFVPVTSTRIVNSVDGIGLPAADIMGGTTVQVQVAGTAGIPADASAVFLNFQVHNRSGTVGSINPFARSSTSRPAGALAFGDDRAITSISATVPLDANGRIHIYLTAGDRIDLMADVQGYFAAGEPDEVGAFRPATASVLDTRGVRKIGPDETVRIPLAGLHGIPSKGLGLSAVALSATVISSASLNGILRTWPTGAPEPHYTSDLLFSGGTQTNLVIADVGDDGSINVKNRSTVSIDLVLNMQGWYSLLPQPSVTCPPEYAIDTWATALPAAPVTCNAFVPETGDTEGSISIEVDGQELETAALPASGPLSLPVSVPNKFGWHEIRLWVTYSDGREASASYTFGLQSGPLSNELSAVQRVRPDALMGVSEAIPSTTTSVALESTASESESGLGSIATDPAEGATISVEGAGQPDENGNPVQVASTSLGIALPFSGTSSNAVPESPGIVSFDNQNGTRTISILKQDSSIQNVTYISGPGAPTRFEYQLDIPAGATLSLDSDGYPVVSDSSGEFIGGASLPWAVDANGVSVETHYELSGQGLTQVVQHSSSNAYPVIADPWLGIALIEKTKWSSNEWKWSPTLKVYPTHWGRYGAGPYARWAAWTETLDKTKRSGWPNPNTSSMRNQFYCHYDFVRIRYPNKSSWNLDTKLPDFGYTGFLRRNCNYEKVF